jgi:DNA replication protein DnaC
MSERLMARLEAERHLEPAAARADDAAVVSTTAAPTQPVLTDRVEPAAPTADDERWFSATDTLSMATLTERWRLMHEDAKLLLSDQLNETDAIGFAREFLHEAAQGHAKILILSGSTGVGKTIAAGWLMLTARPPAPQGAHGARWPTDRHPVIATAAELARWGAFGHEEERSQLARARVTVIDDLGMEDTRSRGFLPYLGELINERAGAPGYTVITTNLDIQGEMPARYAQTPAEQKIWERVTDRFRRWSLWYEIVHPSLRSR